MKQASWAVLAGVTFVVGLGACSTPPATVGGSEATPTASQSAVFEAKRNTLEVQDRILGFIPSESIADVERPLKAELRSCGEDYLWPGGARLTLQGTVDAQGLADTISASFASETGWEVGESPTAGVIGAELRHDDGARFTFVFSEDFAKLNVTSFSACFPFEPEAGKEY